jgi:hypothetical protein
MCVCVWGGGFGRQDLAESLVGDLTPHSGVSKEEKYQLEKARVPPTHAHTASLTCLPAMGGCRLASRR